MFIERNVQLCISGGRVGMITMQSWMFLGTYTKLREHLLTDLSVATMAHLGTGAFDSIGGEVVATTAFVVRGTPSQVPGVYLGLTDQGGEAVQSAKVRAVANGEGREFRFDVISSDFQSLPLSSMAYWLSGEERAIYRDHPQLATLAEPRQGLATSDNNRFLRYWWEVAVGRTCRNAESDTDAIASEARWFPIQKGGTARRWTGNDEFVVNWENAGKELLDHRPRSVIRNPSYYFREGITWSTLSSDFAMRFSPAGFLFETKGSMVFPKCETNMGWILGYLNTPFARELIDCLSPTLDYHEGPVSRIPVLYPKDPEGVTSRVEEALRLAKSNWNRRETSPEFAARSVATGVQSRLRDLLANERDVMLNTEVQILQIEHHIEEHFRGSANISPEVFPREKQRPTGLVDTGISHPTEWRKVLVLDLLSYAVGCIFGRYSLDEAGLILADQGATLQDYLAKVATPNFMPDADNVIPIVDGDWFEDDIVALFRQFLRAAFGEEHFEENLRFVEESLGVKTLRDYFITKTGKSKFYEDHVQRYKKRPIYWMFSSPKGSFNALIYMHRYTPSTVSTVLNEYLREYRGKLEIALQNAEREAAGGRSSKAQKEADRIRKVLVELAEYEHEVLYPLATKQVVIDLDDGVKVNYPKFGTALKKIKGLEATE